MLAVAEVGANASELLRLLHVERALRERAESDARRATQLLLQPRRSLWKPKRRVAACNGSGHTDHPLVSAIVQTFGDGSNARQLTTRLHAALPAAQLEVIINDDSGRDHGQWLALLRQPNDFVVSSPTSTRSVRTTGSRASRAATSSCSCKATTAYRASPTGCGRHPATLAPAAALALALALAPALAVALASTLTIGSRHLPTATAAGPARRADGLQPGNAA